MKAVLSLVLLALVQVRGDEICCGGIGCFTDDYPYDHLPLPRCPDTIPTNHFLYTRDNKNNPEEFDMNNVPTQYFDPSRRTMVIIHGYFNDDNTPWIDNLKDAMLDVEDLNVIVVSWGPVLDYLTAAATVRTVGAEAAVIVDNLVDYGASYDDMWCVGHSLGSHACANLGMRTGQLISRITGLDPAGPWFENYDPSAGINPSVAQFVDIIHTMSHSPILNYGMVRPCGHVDFYPNGGDFLQPGCLTYGGKTPSARNPIACSHHRAIDYFQESASDDCFIARETCDDPYGMPRNCNECNGGSECARMGYYATKPSGGNTIFHLDTRSWTPFCRG